jgi:hypothetical protein
MLLWRNKDENDDFWAELAQIQAESIGWIALGEGAYLHVGSDAPVFPKTQTLPLCLAHFTTKLWLSRKPSAYWVITVCTNFQRLGVDE